jgi:hypothetical protein
LSINKMKTGTLARYEDLRAVIGALLYPMQGQRRGVIPAVTSILAACEFGCIIVAASPQSALELRQALVERLHG